MIYHQSVFEKWQIEDKSVQVIITSPPYYSLRKYKIPDVIIGGDKNCKHEFIINNTFKFNHIQLGYGIRPHIKNTWGSDVNNRNSVEFDRMWLDDELPKYSETIVLSCLKHYLKKIYPQIKYILSYADGSVGNKGIIYQAGNYKKAGEIKSDFYILPSGERVHPVTMWHRHKSRAWSFLQSLYPGIKKAKGKQYRYILKIS